MANNVAFSVTLQTVARSARAWVILPVYLERSSCCRPNHLATGVDIACLQDWARQVAAGERKEKGADCYCETLDGFHDDISSKR
jgi:hypothetical protein